MLSFRISVGGSPLLNLGPAVPDRPVLRIVPAWRTEILIVPTLERADRHAQYLGRGVSTDAVWITPGTVDSKLAPAGFREFVNVDGQTWTSRAPLQRARPLAAKARTPTLCIQVLANSEDMLLQSLLNVGELRFHLYPLSLSRPRHMVSFCPLCVCMLATRNKSTKTRRTPPWETAPLAEFRRLKSCPGHGADDRSARMKHPLTSGPVSRVRCR